MTVRDAEQPRHPPLATAGPVAPLDRYVLSLPSADRERAGAVDRTREIAQMARLFRGATAGVVLTRRGDVLPLRGLPPHPLLVGDPRVLATASRELARSASCTGFLLPAGVGDPERLVRISAIDCAIPGLDHLAAVVVLSPPGDLRGLTTFALRVLGLVVDGTVTTGAIATALGVDVTKVSGALDAALAALSAPDLPAAAVRALRAGLRIPPQCAST
ncbi:MAG: hypothetical protein EPN99_03180 [Frankiales bacterium]|nr:MAG: hypothetical protein EPN99_03180 [Frankiales bacterium]